MSNKIKRQASQLQRQASSVAKVVATVGHELGSSALATVMGKAETALAHVLGLAAPPSVGTAPRVLLAIDATESRKDMWTQAQVAHRSLLQGTDGRIAVQLAHFGGNDRLVCEPWTQDAATLGKQIGRVVCKQGYTQINDVFRHARRLALAPERLAALVYVGDHVESQDQRLSGEAQALCRLGVRGFFFQDQAGCRCGFCHLNLPAGEHFMRRYAELMGGVFYPLGPGSGATLAGLLQAVATFSSGGHQALETLGAGDGRQSAVAREVAYQLTRKT